MALDFGGQTVPSGAYGVGFITGGKFVVMDLGAHDVLQISSQRDADLKRPVPLQVVAASLESSAYVCMPDAIMWSSIAAASSSDGDSVPVDK